MDLNQYARAIASIESAGSGDYQAVGPRTGKGNRAYGRYQVMDFNIGPWTEKYLGQRLTPEQFLASPEAQDAVFRGEFGSYIERYGNPQDAASAWFTGQPLSTGAGRSDILGTTGAGYVEKFNAALGQPQGGNMQPQGLLSTSGQAEPERLPFFQRPQTADFFDRLAIGLGGLTLNPNQALIQASQERLSERRKARETAAQRNATVEFLRARGRSDLADAIQGGLPAADALRIAMTPVEAPTPQSAIAKLEADRRAGLITDEQYQAGLQALAPSGMTIESDGAGGFRLVQGPGAGAGKPLTEGQSKDTVYATRAAGALPTLDKYETALTSIGDVALGADPTGLLRGRMQSEEYQLARQAGDEFLQAILRKDTGAAITAQEQELYGQTYLPQPGDSQEVIAQKRQARRRALAAIKAGLPPSAIVAQERALQESGGALPPEGGPARVTSDAEYDALPSGTVFVGPDGKTRRKP